MSRFLSMLPMLSAVRLLGVISVAGVEEWRGLLSAALLVLLAYQQRRLYAFRQQAAKREELFRIVAENAADMIALVDVKGHRLYNSPAYQKVLGYSPAELAGTHAFEQIHPEDRFKVLDAAREACETGLGKKLEYRIRHKDGTWRVLESNASTIRNEKGDVEKLVIVNRDISERKRAEEQLEHNSFHDLLTGLPNRRLFLDRLQQAFARAQRNLAYQYAVLFVDVDGFKVFNDTMGPAVGDQIIVEIGRRLESCLRQDDTVARPKGRLPIPDAVLSRMGGDEFTILLDGIKDPSDALRVGRRIQAKVSAPLMVSGRELRAAASVGITLSATAHEQAEHLLQDADVAMRRAKALGGSRCEVFDEAMHTRAVNLLKLEADLRNAIDHNQFRLCYQPIVNLESREITGFEALLRWQHPEQGLISPDKFIEVADNIGLIVSIGQWVVREACRQLRAWQSRPLSLGTLSMTVNLSARQFAHPHLASDIRAAVQETGIEPSRLQLEIAEGLAMADAKLTSDVLPQLKHLGVGVSIGDFGTG